MITTIYERSDINYSKAKYGDVDVIMNMENGYVNATKICKRKKLIKDLIDINDIYEVRSKFSYINGIYVHPELIPFIISHADEFKNMKCPINQFINLIKTCVKSVYKVDKQVDDGIMMVNTK